MPLGPGDVRDWPEAALLEPVDNFARAEPHRTARTRAKLERRDPASFVPVENRRRAQAEQFAELAGLEQAFVHDSRATWAR